MMAISWTETIALSVHISASFVSRKNDACLVSLDFGEAHVKILVLDVRMEPVARKQLGFVLIHASLVILELNATVIAMRNARRVTEQMHKHASIVLLGDIRLILVISTARVHAITKHVMQLAIAQLGVETVHGDRCVNNVVKKTAKRACVSRETEHVY